MSGSSILSSGHVKRKADANAGNPPSESGASAAAASFAERMVLLEQRFKSRAEFARRAGISTSGFQRYFEGGEPSLSALVAIARAAGVRVEWLATGEGPKEPGPDALIAQLAAEGELVPVDEQHYAGVYARRGTTPHARLAALRALSATAALEADAELEAVVMGAPAIAKGFGWPINGDQIGELIIRARRKLRERASPGSPVNAGELIRAVVDAYEELRGKKR